MKTKKKKKKKNQNSSNMIKSLIDIPSNGYNYDEVENIILIHNDYDIYLGIAELNDYKPICKIQAPNFTSSFKSSNPIYNTLPIDMTNEEQWLTVINKWTLLFQYINVNYHKCNIIFPLQINSSHSYKKILQQIFFEHFHFKGIHISCIPLTIAYSYGVFTGLMIDMTYNATYIVPIVDGFIIKNAIRTSYHLSMSKLCSYLIYRLRDKYNDIFISYTTPQMYKIALGIIKQYSFLVLNYQQAIDHIENYQRLLDINLMELDLTLNITDELFTTSEILFQPNSILLDELDIISLPLLIKDAIESCAIDNRKELLNSICPSGTGSMIIEFTNKLTYELKKIFPNNINQYIKVKNDPLRVTSSYTGTAILTTLPDFYDHMQINQQMLVNQTPQKRS